MKRLAMLTLAAAILSPLAGSAESARQGHAARASQALHGCALLPPGDAFHRKVSKLKALKHSAKMIHRVAGSHLYADFASDHRFGIPYTVVAHNRKRVKVHVRRHSGFPRESDKGRQPIPPNARIQSGRHSRGDRHTLVVRRGKHHGSPCKLIELYRARYEGGKGHRWSADQVSVFNLGRKLPQRPKGWTSADAAGLPILPGLVRYGEVKRGHINHAIRITFERTRAAYRSPARHYASPHCSAKLPAMGDRLRLRRGYPLKGLNRNARVVATALKRYGAIVADNGMNFGIGGSTDGRWTNRTHEDLSSIPGKAFQFVKTGNRLVKAPFC